MFAFFAPSLFVSSETKQAITQLAHDFDDRSLELASAFVGECYLFTDRSLLSKFLKFKHCRFKLVNTRDEAECFFKSCLSEKRESDGEHTYPYVKRVTLPTPQEKVSPRFHIPKPYELAQLRKTILADDSVSFLALVMSNPHFLVTTSDTPTILHDGARYNTLHMCAQKNKTSVAHALISTIESDWFWKLIYPEDDETSRVDRMHYMIDLYLNTPEKNFGETPLHISAKFGHHSMIELLTSHPKTCRSVVNGDGSTPTHIAGSRCSKFFSQFDIDQGPFYVLCYTYQHDITQIVFRVAGTSREEHVVDYNHNTVGKKVLDWRSCHGDADNYNEHKNVEDGFILDAYLGPASKNSCKKMLLSLKKIWYQDINPKSSLTRLTKYLTYRKERSELCNKFNFRLKEYFLINSSYVNMSQQLPKLIKLCEQYLKMENNEFFCVEQDSVFDASIGNDLSLLHEQSELSLLDCSANSSLGSLTKSFANLSIYSPPNISIGESNFSFNDSMLADVDYSFGASVGASGDHEYKSNDNDDSLGKVLLDRCSSGDSDDEVFVTPPSSPVLTFSDAVDTPFVSFCYCKTSSQFYQDSKKFHILNNYIIFQLFELLIERESYENYKSQFPLLCAWAEKFKVLSLLNRVNRTPNCDEKFLFSCKFCKMSHLFNEKKSENVALLQLECDFNPFCLELS